MKKKTPRLINEYNRLFGGTCRGLLNETRSDIQFIIDDIFFLWDEFFDDGRRGIERGTVSNRDQGTYEQFIFSTEDVESLEDFEDKLVPMLKKERVKFDLSADGVLMVWDEDAVDGNGEPLAPDTDHRSEKEREDAARIHFKNGIKELRKYNGYNDIEKFFSSVIKDITG